MIPAKKTIKITTDHIIEASFDFGPPIQRQPRSLVMARKLGTSLRSKFTQREITTAAVVKKNPGIPNAAKYTKNCDSSKSSSIRISFNQQPTTKNLRPTSLDVPYLKNRSVLTQYSINHRVRLYYIRSILSIHPPLLPILPLIFYISKRRFIPWYDNRKNDIAVLSTHFHYVSSMEEPFTHIHVDTETGEFAPAVLQRVRLLING